MSKFRLELRGLRPGGSFFESKSVALGNGTQSTVGPRPVRPLYLFLFLAVAAAVVAGGRAHAATGGRAIQWRLVAQHPDLCRVKIRPDLVTIGLSVTTPDENGNFALFVLCSDHITREFHNQ